MKNTYILILLSVATFSLYTSCSKDDGALIEDLCIINKTEYVTSITAPDAGVVNQPININVSFAVINGCGQFGRFIETQDDTVLTIEVEAKYVGCYCTQDVPTRTVNYVFTPTTIGNYEFKFKSSETEFITTNIIVN